MNAENPCIYWCFQHFYVIIEPVKTEESAGYEYEKSGCDIGKQNQ